MNSCQFVGRFLKKPNLKVFEKSSGGNTFVTNFTLEISRIFRKKNGEEREQVNQFDFEAWDVGAKLITDSFDSGDWITVHASAKRSLSKTPKQESTQLESNSESMNSRYQNGRPQ